MTDQRSFGAKVGHTLAWAAFIAVLVGLPLAVQLNSPSIERLRASLHARDYEVVSILSPVSLSDYLMLTLDRGLVTNSEQGAVGDVNAARRIEIHDATLTLDLSRLATPPTGTSEADAQQAIPMIARIGGYKAGALFIRRGKLNLLSASGTRYLVTDLEATVTGARNGTYKIVGTGKYLGQTLSLTGTWNEDPLRSRAPDLPLRLSLTSPFITASFEGFLKTAAIGSHATPTLSGEAQIQVPDLRAMSGWTGLARVAGKQIKQISISGPVTWNAEQMSFARASVHIDKNDAIGALTFRHAGPRPAIDATLGFRDMNFAGLFLEQPTTSPAETSETPRGANLLALIDADLRLSAETFRLPYLQTGRGALTIALNEGRLVANLVDLELEGGTVDGQISMDANQPRPRAEVRIKAQGIDAGRILALPLARKPMNGPTNVFFEGTADAASPAEMFAKLSGQGQLELAAPGTLNLDVATLTSAAKAAPTVGWTAAGKSGMAIEKLSCQFRLLNGAVTLQTMQARSGELAVFGAGRIDVPGRLMDVSLASGPASSGEAPATAQDVLSLRGTWDNPAISILRAPPPPVKAVELFGAH